jgi:prepilin-type N-terminal cleavage/methylation domain-containing protein
MNRGTQWVKDQRGVSLIETLVVVVIIVIVSAMALMQRGSANAAKCGSRA